MLYYNQDKGRKTHQTRKVVFTMRKTYTVVMYENWTDVVAERTYTNKKAAFEMARWYMERKYEQLHPNKRDTYALKTCIRDGVKMLRENGKIPFMVRIRED